MTNQITLPFPPKELNPNWTGKLKAKMRAIKAYRDTCYWMAKEKRLVAPDSEIVRLCLSFYVPAGRVMPDDDNLIGYFKRGRDGIALALNVDDKRFKTQVNYIGRDPDKAGKIVVTLEGVK